MKKTYHWIEKNTVLATCILWLTLVIGWGATTLVVDGNGYCNQAVAFLQNVKCVNALYVNQAAVVNYDGSAWSGTDISGKQNLAVPTMAGNIARLNILGQAYDSQITIGTGANNIPQLDGSGKLPAVDGSQLTSLPTVWDRTGTELQPHTSGDNISQVDSGAAVSGINLIVRSGNGGTGTNILGSNLILKSGSTTGLRTSQVEIWAPLAGTTSANVHLPVRIGMFGLLSGGNSAYMQLGTNSASTAKQGITMSANTSASSKYLEVCRTAGGDYSGNPLTINAGGSTIASTDLAGGNLSLNSGIATGDGGSIVSISAVKSTQGAGTTDRSPTEHVRFDGTGTIFNNSALEQDFTIQKLTSGTAYIYDAGLDTHTFGSFPITPSSAPTADYQVANKKYVDDNISSRPPTTVINQLSQALAANSFNQNTAANQAYIVNLPTSPSDGDIIEVFNSVANGGIDSYTKTILHLDNNATDSALTPHTLTPANITYDTTDGKFSYYSILNGTSAKYNSDTHVDFNLYNVDWTIDCWIKPTEISTNDRLFGIEDPEGVSFGIYFDGATTITCGNMNVNNLGQSATVTAGVWQHIAVVKYGTRVSIYVDGTSGAVNNSYEPITNEGDRFLSIGQTTNYAGGWYDGRIDEVRITKGLARWTTNFTPPTSAYFSASITVNPDDAHKIGTQNAGVSRVLNTQADYEKYRWDGSQWWVVAHEGTPVIGN